jgi:hypothetical protein
MAYLGDIPTPDALGPDDIQDGAVTTDKIADAAVTADKINGGHGSGVDADTVDGIEGSVITENANAIALLNLAVGGVMILADQKPDTTSGGPSVVGDNIRDLNTVIKNTISGASLSANRVQLPLGSYFILAMVPSYHSGQAKSYLFNYTDTLVEVTGSSSYSANGSNAAAVSTILDGFTIATTKQFELKLTTVGAFAINGLGVASSSGLVEVYSQVYIAKIG